LTRWWLLAVLTAVNLLNYIDRTIFAALMPEIKKDLGFSDSQLGLLGSAFILAYLLVSPLFGYWGDRGPRAKIMAAGLALWSGATAFSGLTTTFIGQFFTRVTVGVGESAYSVIAPGTIADCFAKTARGKIYAVYSAAIPVGSALGYVLGGALAPRLGWHRAFFIVGVPGLLVALLLFFLPDPKRGATELSTRLSREPAPQGASPQALSPQEMSLQETRPEKGERSALIAVYRGLFRNGGFMTTVLGCSAYTFVLGGLAFWMPSFIVRYFAVSLERGNLIFGGVTVAGGFCGTMLGGWWSDRIEKKTGNGYLKVCVYSIILAIPLYIWTMQSRTFMQFAVILFFMEVAIFLCMSPLDAAVIGFVQPKNRATAMALNIFIIHLLGDGISRWLMGVVSDRHGLNVAVQILPVMLVVAALFWSWGLVFFWRPVAWPQGALELPRWQAHRGYRPGGTVQENTLAAFRLASQAGATMTECDIRLTADREVVVFHDSDLARIGGKPGAQVSQLTLKEMRQIVDVTTLRELLSDKASPPMINIEIKSESLRAGGLEAEAVEIIRQTGAMDRVMFSSFNPFALGRLARLAPEIPRALLVTARGEKGNRIWLKQMWFAFYARPHLLHLDELMIKETAFAAWADRGIPVVAWTVNDLSRARALLAMGVRSIISDQLISESKALK
jgi:MFS family permease